MRLFLLIEAGEEEAGDGICDELLEDSDNDDAVDVDESFEVLLLTTFDIDRVRPTVFSAFLCIGDGGDNFTNKDGSLTTEFLKFISFIDFDVCTDCFLLLISCRA